jgi:pyruvate dehydrogenase kinase 2/3/4
MTKEMLYLPDKLIKTPSVQMVYNWYLQSFEECLTHKEMKISKEELLRFAKTLNNIVKRHTDVVQNMAMGILQLQETYGIDNKTEQNIQYFLDRFLMSRISIRMIINQHLILFNEDHESHRHLEQIGSIDLNCDVKDILQDAYDNAKFLSDQYYLCSPEIEFEEHNIVEKGKKVELVYVPSHLYHIAFELYKNAMRAVIEFHGDGARDFPKLKTLIVKGKEDISIRITDFGGGLSYRGVSQIWKYMYSTAPRPSISSDVYSTQSSAPLAGYGYGLPLSRLYARYFNGDLTISSVDGLTTDAYIYLKTLSKDANESLPLHNKTSISNYKYTNRLSNADWT